ncbi:UNVERIFIED_CONTAM: hypothetical protein K2H54_008142 [Gekko kuhli]
MTGVANHPLSLIWGHICSSKSSTPTQPSTPSLIASTATQGGREGSWCQLAGQASAQLSKPALGLVTAEGRESDKVLERLSSSILCTADMMSEGNREIATSDGAAPVPMAALVSTKDKKDLRAKPRDSRALISTWAEPSWVLTLDIQLEQFSYEGVRE